MALRNKLRETKGVRITVRCKAMLFVQKGTAAQPAVTTGPAAAPGIAAAAGCTETETG